MGINHPLDITDYQSRDLYLGNDTVKRAGSKTKWTVDLIAEYKKCKNDIVYFCKTYVKLIHIDRGIINFEPYDYQEDLWQKFKDHRFNCVLACRQSGKSQCVVGFLLHYAIFNSNKEIAIVAHQRGQAVEVLSRFKLALENLPFFLQPGCKKFNDSKIEFDNNSVVGAYSATSGSLRGKSIALLYLDEFAFVENADKFMESTYPTISSGKSSKIIITSTPNGVANEFYKIYEKGKLGLNSYVVTEVNWWNVPGRDEKWKDATIQDIGEERFNREYGNDFNSDNTSLISPNALLKIKPIDPIIMYEDGSMHIYEEPIENHKYIATIDGSYGMGQDYTTMTIFDVTSRPYKQVALYRNNLLSHILFPDIAIKYLKMYNNAFCLVEYKESGISIADDLYYNFEYEFMYSDKDPGVRVNKAHKSLGCSNLKNLIELKKLTITSKITVEELFNFKRDKNSWNAASGHDDTVANLWLFSWFLGTDLFEYLFEKNKSLKDLIDIKNELSIEDAVVDPILPDSYNSANAAEISELKKMLM